MKEADNNHSNGTTGSSSSQKNTRADFAQSNPQSNDDGAQSNCLSSQEDGTSTQCSNDSNSSSSRGSSDGGGEGNNNGRPEQGALSASIGDKRARESDKTERYPHPHLFTLSTHPLNISTLLTSMYQYTLLAPSLSTHPINPPTHATFSTHPINSPYHPTPSMQKTATMEVASY